MGKLLTARGHGAKKSTAPVVNNVEKANDVFFGVELINQCRTKEIVAHAQTVSLSSAQSCARDE